MDAFESNLSRVKSIAADNGWVLNSDPERVKKVVGLMADNYIQYGNYYCPCKQSGEFPEADDVLCPCPEVKQEIQEKGHCYCRLFYKPDAVE